MAPPSRRLPASRFPRPNLTGSRSVNMGTGFVGVISVGYGLGNGLRLELEGGYRENRFKSVGGNGAVGRANFDGTENKYTGMLNVLYDFDPAVIGLGSIPVVPYIGRRRRLCLGAGQGRSHPRLRASHGRDQRSVRSVSVQDQ